MNVAELIDLALSGPFPQQLAQILGIIVLLAACFAVVFSIVGDRFKTSFVRVLAVAFGLSSILHFALNEGKEADEAQLQQSYETFNKNHAGLLDNLDETHNSTQFRLVELTGGETLTERDILEVNSLRWLLQAVQRFADSATNLSIDSLPAEALALSGYVTRIGGGDVLRPDELARLNGLFSEFEVLHANLESILERRGEVHDNEAFVGAYSWFILLILVGGAMEIGSECRNVVPSFRAKNEFSGANKSVEERLVQIEDVLSKVTSENGQIEPRQRDPT